MKTIQMRQFGSTLTGRADGKRAFQEIIRTTLPVSLDFKDVVSLGSSFGDEVILAVAESQDNAVTVLHANKVIQNAIRRSIEDTPVSVSFLDSPDSSDHGKRGRRASPDGTSGHGVVHGC